MEQSPRMISHRRRPRSLLPALAALLPALLAAPPAQADDGLASLENGVITFSKSATIAMKSEVLRLSLDRIEADFVFLNTGTADETVTVAFPLPEIDMSSSDGLNIPFGDRDNFTGFSTMLDGRTVTEGFEQRAFLPDGTDKTAELKAAGLPLVRDYWTYVDLLKALPEATQKRLIAEGLAEGEPGDLAPAFRVRSHVWFQATFPAGRPVALRHAYAPSYDISNMSVFSSEDFPPAPDLVSRYCLTGDVKAKVRAAEAARAGSERPWLPQFTLDYILATARTWAGPIGSFHLIVETGGANRILASCLDLAPTAPGRYEMQATDYVPRQDIHLMLFGEADQ